MSVTKSGGWLELERYLVFTDARALVVRQGTFLSDGVVDQELPWTSVRTVGRVPGSDRDDGFDLWIEAGTAAKSDVHKFALRDSSLSARGEAFVERLTSLVGGEARALESSAG